MATVKAKKTAVLVRDTSTTTYHFGLSVPICEEQPSQREAAPAVWLLTDALSDGRRLCRLCANLVDGWTSAILSQASATHISHPSR